VIATGYTTNPALLHIHNGMINAKQGRTTEELGTISGALTLLANVVMAWNTHHLQVMLDRAPGDHPDEVISRPCAGSVTSTSTCAAF